MEKDGPIKSSQVDTARLHGLLKGACSGAVINRLFTVHAGPLGTFCRCVG